MPTESPEGIFRGATSSAGDRYFSVSQIETQDLLSEGQIEGIVTGEYLYNGTQGNVGWDTATLGPTYSFLRSMYWNEVPVMDSSNNLNFQQVTAKVSKGKPNGEVDTRDKLKEETSLTRNISERLRGPTYIGGRLAAAQDEFAKIYRVLNKDCSRINVNVKVTSLSKTSRLPASMGDIVDSYVECSLRYRPLFSTAGKEVSFISSGADFKVRGKSSGPYIHSAYLGLAHSHSLDPDFIGWEIKIWRNTAEPETMDIRNQTYVDSITEVYNSKFAYPNSAIVSQKFSAEYFSSIPQRAFDTRGIKVKIPSNYDPIKKTYTNYWDGKFSTDTSGPYGGKGKYWTDNPAWCFYDLITNSRYGLGKYIPESFVDKWSLYEIAKYCDVLVPDGMGSVEPRFTCNLYIQSRDEAFKVVNDMASIFRGIAYSAAGGIFTIQDSEKDSIYTFSNASVKDGDFNYSNSSKKVRHTVAIIRYNDKTNFYKPAIEYVEDVDGIRRHGIRETEMTAFGCTSRGQAVRLGRWALFTENMETESISFSVGVEGAYMRPGDVFTIHDSNRTTKRWAGRCKMIDIYPSSSTHTDGYNKIVIDQDIMAQVKQGREYKFTLLTPTYNYDPTQVTDLDSRDYSDIRRTQIQNYVFTGSNSASPSVAPYTYDNGNTGHYPELSGYTVVNLFSGFNDDDHVINKNSVWTIEPTSADYTASELEDGVLPDNKFRVIKTEETEDGFYNVAGLEYSENKYSAIESGLSFDDAIVTIVPDPPKDIILSERVVTTNTRLIDYEITKPDNLNGLSNYNVYTKQASQWSKRDYTGNYPYLISQGNLDAKQTDDKLIPDARWRVAVLPHDTRTDTYLPTGKGDYIFRAFSSNIAGVHSQGSAVKKINISKVQPLLDVKIKNLRELDDTDQQDNPAGHKQSYTTTKTDLKFKWETEVASEQVSLSNYSYRITVREPTFKQSISSNILYETTDYNPDSNLYAEGSTALNGWDLDFTGNAGNLKNGPWRQFDVVVEAHDDNNNSSAGGTFSSTSDSNYTNTNGYDKYEIFNPAITDPILGTSSNIITEQTLTIDKEVKILFRRNKYTDIEGAYVYISKDPFTTSDVQWKTSAKVASDRASAGKAVIEIHKVEPFNNTIIVTPEDYDLRNTETAYIAYSLYDSFDKQRAVTLQPSQEPLLQPNVTDMHVSNVATIKKGTEIIDVVGDGYKVWVRMTVDGRWVGKGIDRVEALDMTKNASNGALPDRYKKYNGFSQYSCSAIHSYLGVQDPWGGAYGPFNVKWASDGGINGLGRVPAGELAAYFPNYYCGWVPRTLNRGGRIRPVYNDMNNPGAGIKKWEKMDNYKETFRRYRIWIDTKFAPDSDDYAIIGLNINNHGYEDLHPVDQQNFQAYYIHTMELISRNPVWKDANGNSTEPGGYDSYYGSSPGGIQHHPAGFGQGFGNLVRNKKYFDVHLGHLIDMSYLKEGFFGMLTQGDDKDQGGKTITPNMDGRAR